MPDCIYEAECGYTAMTAAAIGTKECKRKTSEDMISNLMPAAFYWYLYCTVFGAAGYMQYNPSTNSNHLLHNGAARTCQQTVAQFHLSIASRSSTSITLQKLKLKLECSLNGWRSTVAFSSLTNTPLTLDICQIEGKDSNFVFHFAEDGISHQVRCKHNHIFPWNMWTS